MTRPPDPNARPRLVFDARDTGEELHIRGFKEVCARDGLEVSRELDLLLMKWLNQHHWPPGNPQTLITNHLDGPKWVSDPDIPGARVYEVKVVCEFCGQRHTAQVTCTPPSEGYE